MNATQLATLLLRGAASYHAESLTDETRPAMHLNDIINSLADGREQSNDEFETNYASELIRELNSYLDYDACETGDVDLMFTAKAKELLK